MALAATAIAQVARCLRTPIARAGHRAALARWAQVVRSEIQVEPSVAGEDPRFRPTVAVARHLRRAVWVATLWAVEAWAARRYGQAAWLAPEQAVPMELEAWLARGAGSVRVVASPRVAWSWAREEP